MQRVLSNALRAHAGERVHVTGWLHAVRRLGAIAFAIVRDGWGTTQAVLDGDAAADAAAIAPESIVRIDGEVVAAAGAPDGVELRAATLTVLEPAVAPAIPLGKRALSAGLPTLLDQAVVLNRHPTRRAVTRVAAAATSAFRAALDARGFTEIRTPKLVGSATEGGANVFAVDYFGRGAYLAQSPQFYKQIMCGALERVYEVAPVFRAEPHDTVRHLSEYVSLDAEIAFIEDHVAVMDLVAEVVRAMLTRVRACGDELALIGAQAPEPPGEIPRLRFTEAKEIARRRTGVDGRDEPDLSPAEERALGAWARDECGSELLFVEGYPLAKRPFYTAPDPRRPRHSNSFDLLFRGLELVTGGQRLHREADYLAALAARGLPSAPLAWYLAAFRHGMRPHGGFAIGLERFVMQALSLANVRLAALFPRDVGRLTP